MKYHEKTFLNVFLRLNFLSFNLSPRLSWHRAYARKEATQRLRKLTETCYTLNMLKLVSWRISSKYFKKWRNRSLQFLLSLTILGRFIPSARDKHHVSFEFQHAIYLEIRQRTLVFCARNWNVFCQQKVTKCLKMKE